MRVVPSIALLLLALALGGCALGGSPARYNATADKAAIREVIRSAWKAEYAGDESTACLYFTPSFIDEQNRIWEAGAAHRTGCAIGSVGNHPYLRLNTVPSEFVNDRLRFAWTRVSTKSRTATAHPILPGGSGCLNPVDCHIVISLVIHLVDEKRGGWLINDLDASACVARGYRNHHSGCVPLTAQQVL
jgi:hypothetical protein